MTCPRCYVAELSPLTGVCELCGYALDATVAVERADVTTELATRQLAHEFVLGDLLGRGAHSAIHRATELTTGRKVVLKVLPRRTDEPDAEASFRAMLGAFAGFDHPHLVPILRYGSTDSLFWYAMKDIGSTSLRTLLREKGPMEARTCRRIITQVVSALDYLHRHGVVHGAIKPDNVLVDKDGWVHVCDPSFVRARAKRRPRPSPARGTARVDEALPPRPAWVAPEDHARGERLPAADQFAVAVLAYECVTGRAPSMPPKLLLRELPDAPQNMARAVDRALSEDPWQRYPSCADFLWAMEEGSASSAEVRPRGRVTEGVVLIDGWKPPTNPRRRLFLIGRVVASLIVVGALAASVPTIMQIVRPAQRSATRTRSPRRDPAAGARVATDSAASAGAAATPLVESLAAPGPTGIPPRLRASDIRAQTPPRTAPRAAPDERSPRKTAVALGTSATPKASPIASAPAPAPATQSAAATARLFVNASPWGQVFVDGTLVGNTPKANLELSPGSHVVRVMRAGFGSYERTLRVQAGDTLRLTDIVLVPGRP